MSFLRYCTLTGVDESIPLDALWQLSEEFPFVEWGILYSPTRQSQGRYPSLQWIEALAKRLETEEFTPHFALHLCGTAAKDFIGSPGGPVGKLARAFRRMQLNFFSGKYQTQDIAHAISWVAHSTRVITQGNRANAELLANLRMHQLYNHEVLFDESGGRGITRDSWPVVDAFESTRFGYAGGLGPDNLATELPKIRDASNGKPFWVDMEGKLRTQGDTFDLGRARECLQIVQTFLEEEQSLAFAVHNLQWTRVESLSGLWLDWWVGKALGYNMSTPPVNAIKATYMQRSTGKYHSVEFQGYWNEAGAVLEEHRIGVVANDDGSWTGIVGPVTAPTVTMPGPNPRIAALRAVVAASQGEKVLAPAN